MPDDPCANRIVYIMIYICNEIRKTDDLRLHRERGVGAVEDERALATLAVLADAVDDFRRPLQLLAAGLAFTDPVDGRPRRYSSVRSLPLVAEE